MSLSVLEAIFKAVKSDFSSGFQWVPAKKLDGDQLALGQSVIIEDIQDAQVLSFVAPILNKKYPLDHKVAWVADPGTAEERVEWFTLNEELPFQMNSTSNVLFVPALKQDERTKTFQTLQFYLDEITGEGGDVWIKQQTHETLIPYLREETEELIEAIKNQDTRNLIEELGDVLCQVLYQTSYAEYTGAFTLEDVLEAINTKLRRRHPHVFDGVEANTVEEVDAIWQKIKAREKELGL
ncbi:hypothetical protein JTF06_10860 [Desemzia sp. RIT804]|uniref:MazG nucleotide pyrophosphohydrolase domain-containing protein n=1 Tax=Desemzia sp. RIT 804 TaxID=2810209 RepID=UPI0019514E8E|nr:MazG nucleotide pyrophosphohydrolase domain-containing protein [Desemzia sp. RIT 804]MBM6615389.1 hypothetical protein [Desemzia sp. RIT 804]